MSSGREERRDAAGPVPSGSIPAPGPGSRPGPVSGPWGPGSGPGSNPGPGPGLGLGSGSSGRGARGLGIGESEPDEWCHRLTEAAEHLVSEDMRRSAAFLIASRPSDQGWSAYPGLPVDLRCTAEAVTALTAMRYPEARTIAGGAQLAARSRLADPAGLTVADLIDLAFIASADHDDGDHVESLAEAMSAAMRDPAEISTTTLARALVAVTPWRPSLRDRVAGPWLTELLRRRSGDGSWQVADDTTCDSPVMTAVPATAAAVRALAGWRTRAPVAEAVGNGLTHLRALLREDGWEHPLLAATYPLAAVVRALAVEPDRETDLILVGVRRLCALRDADGAWGGTTAEAPAVEHTAVAVVALVEAGACQYVPLATSRAGIQALAQLVTHLVQERDALATDIERRVEQRSAEIIADRDLLREQLRRRDRELARLRRTVPRRHHDPADDPDNEPEEQPEPGENRPGRLSPLRTVRSRLAGASSPLIAAGITAGLAVTGITAAVTNLLDTEALPAPYAILAALVAGLATMSVLLVSEPSRPARVRRDRPDRMAQRMVDELVTMTREVPTSTREELMYRLVRDGPDLPAEALRRVFTELIARWRISPATDRALHSWTDRFLRLEPDDRKAVADRIRATLL